MDWSHFTLIFVLFICFTLTSSQSGQWRHPGRFTFKRRPYVTTTTTTAAGSSDSLITQQSTSDYDAKFPPIPPTKTKSDRFKVNPSLPLSPGKVISASRITESLSLTSASISAPSESRVPSSSVSPNSLIEFSSSSTPPDFPSSPSIPPQEASSSPSSPPYDKYEPPINPIINPIDPIVPGQPSVQPADPFVPPKPPKFPDGSAGLLTQETAKIVASNNIFGFKLYKALTKFNGAENMLISPFSLFSTLMTVYAGSSDSTETEMIDLLELKTLTENQVQTAFRDVQHDLLYELNKANELKLLNAIFVDKDFNISSDYVDTIRTYYNAILEKVEFRRSPAYTTRWTNGFVKYWTKGLIPALLDSTLDPLTSLLLINVIYFKGNWAEPFTASLTDETIPFRNFDQTTSKVPMMRATSLLHYNCDYTEIKACFVEKLYAGGTLGFLAITPTNGTDLTYLESLLGTEQMNDAIAQMQEYIVELGLPRFSVTGSYDLLKPLEFLGVKAAFSAEDANLAKMSTSKGLFVKEAKHKSVIKVTEEGTLAAGATVAEIGTRKRPPRLIIDRPFLFLIRDVKRGTILFLGRINSLA